MAKYRVIDVYPEYEVLRYRVERYGLFGWSVVEHFRSLDRAKEFVDRQVKPKVLYES